MPRGPKVATQVLEYLTYLAMNDLNALAKDIRDALVKRFEDTDFPIPKLRTIQHYAKLVRDQAKRNTQEEPWSLASMGQPGVDIPREAAGFLLEALSDLRHRQNEGEPLWPWSSHPLGTVLTNRQAKWLWQIHLIVPTLEVREVYERADEYAHRELLADYLKQEFDTSDLDGSLMNLLRDIKRRGSYPSSEDNRDIERRED